MASHISTTSAEFDRFDICEAWYVYALDWGEYHIVTRLQRMQFRPSPRLSRRSDLSANGRIIYDALDRGARERQPQRPGTYTCLCPKQYDYMAASRLVAASAAR